MEAKVPTCRRKTHCLHRGHRKGICQGQFNNNFTNVADTAPSGRSLMRNGGAYMLWLELSEAAAKKRQKSRRPAGITVPLAFCLYQTPSGVLELSRDAMSNRSISSIGICIIGSASSSSE